MASLLRNKAAGRIESRFERLIWKFRLVTILPVVMSLMGSMTCFILGTQEEIEALQHIFKGVNLNEQTWLIGNVIGGIDYYVIGIALLIFGYGIYELIISDIDPRHQESSSERRNLLSIDSLESLKQKLTNVIVVALIVSAFKTMIGLEVKTATELLLFCACVLMLALSAWLIGKSHNH